MLPMDMTEEVRLDMKVGQLHKYLFRSIVDTIIKIKNAICRRMCYQHIGVIRYRGIIACLPIADAVFCKHWHTVELRSIYIDAGIAKIMDTAIKAIHVCLVKATIMVATNEYLVAIRQIAEPIKEIKCFSFFAKHAEISGVNHNISLRQFL